MGDIPQAYQRPFLGLRWAPTQIYISGPFWGPAQHQAESKLINHRTIYSDQHRTVYSDQSQDSLFLPITDDTPTQRTK